MKRILIVGSGAREHAIAWKLRQSPEIGEIFVAPGNAGTDEVATNVAVTAGDVAGITRFADERQIDLTLIGPEAPLAAGVSDALQDKGLRVVGPNAGAARIESSKSFAKDVMRRANVPTAWYQAFDDAESARRFLAAADYPLVVKADGLAAGKGVVICRSREEALAAIKDLMVDRVHGVAGDRIVVEEFLSGPEMSLMALVDGRRGFALPPSQDHKRLLDGDKGPNTGGMGAYAPVPLVAATASDVAHPSLGVPSDGDPQAVQMAHRLTERLVARLIDPVVRTLAEMGMSYRGILYAGLMLTSDGPKVLEFNCRLGDPETQVLMPLIQGDLLPYLEAVAAGELDDAPPVTTRAAAGVVLAAPGYPDEPCTDSRFHGLGHTPENMLVFHAGTRRNQEGEVVTAGGRVLTVVGTGADVGQAVESAYRFPLWFDRMQFRTDIAWQARPDKSRRGMAETELVPA